MKPDYKNFMKGESVMEENNIVTTQEETTTGEYSEGLSDYGVGMITGAVLTAATYGCVKLGKWIYRKFKKKDSGKVVVLEKGDTKEVTEDTEK